MLTGRVISNQTDAEKKEARRKRLVNELAYYRDNPVPDYSLVPLDEDLSNWQATIRGPAGTPYENGLFHLDMTVPEKYPFKAPEVLFKTKIYHPNINSNGYICLDILSDTWTPALTLGKVLLSIASILDSPNTEDPFMPHIALAYKTDKAHYNKTAAEWTDKYARAS